MGRHVEFFKFVFPNLQEGEDFLSMTQTPLPQCGAGRGGTVCASFVGQSEVEVATVS